MARENCTEAVTRTRQAPRKGPGLLAGLRGLVGGPGDPSGVFITSVFLLVAFGTVMVFSASAFHWSVRGDPHFFLRRQLAWVVFAFLGCFVATKLDLRVLRRYYWQPLLLVVVLLLVVLVPQIGHKVNASRRWIPLPGGLQFQPSELAKVAVIIFVAGFLSREPAEKNQTFRSFLAVCLTVLPVFGLILIEPDFGTAMFVLGLAFFIVILSGVKKLYLLGSGLLFAPIIAVFVHYRWETIQLRLLGFLSPEDSYQVKHSLTALGSGGLWGLGLGASEQKLQFLPESHTDFILAIIGEELGLAGCAVVIILFAALLWSGVTIVWRSRDLHSFLIGSGIVVSLVFQAVFNMAVVTASAPTKGIPLPLITFGGSGLFVTMLQVGVLLSLDRANRGRQAKGAVASPRPLEAAKRPAEVPA